MPLEPASVDALRALGLGFALSGALGSGFEWTTRRRLGLRLLRSGDGFALISVPVLVFSAPFAILRDACARPKPERNAGTVMAATIVAGLWSLASGFALIDAASLLLPA